MGLHVIIGEDDFLIGEVAKKIVGDGVGLETIDSLNSTNAELQLADLRRVDDSVSTPPFLDPRKVTWWKNVHFLPGGKKSAAEDVKVALEAFAKRLVGVELPENQEFILSGPHLLKTSILAKTLATAADVVSFAAEKPWEASRNAAVRAIDFAKEVGLKFAPGAAELFVSRVGTDSRSIVSELGKMRNYLGEGADTIRTADIAEVTSQGIGVEPEVWAITDALGERNLAKVLEATQRFEGENGFAVLVTTVVEKFFRQLIDIRDGRTEGMAPYAVQKNRGYLRKWSPAELQVGRARFLALRENAVSGSGSIDTLVVTNLVRICRR